MSHCDTGVRPSSIEDLITLVKRVHSLIYVRLRNGNDSGVEWGFLRVKHGEIGTVKRKDGLSFCIDCFSMLKTWKDGMLSCVELL
jgi:hypothetical protein